MKTSLVTTLAVLGAIAIPAAANAQSRAFATTDVNLRAGPSTSYPAVDVVGAGDGVRVFGCLSTRAWCDVGYAGIRGWMSSNYLAEDYRVQRYTGPTVVREIGAPIISFSVGSYWGDHYRGRGFYRDRDRYIGRGPGPSRREIRREIREERREDRREDRRRDARQERREDIRDARRDFREDRREDRREVRQDRREDRRDRREVRQDRREDRRDRREDRRERRDDRRDDGPPRPLYRVN